MTYKKNRQLTNREKREEAYVLNKAAMALAVGELPDRESTELVLDLIVNHVRWLMGEKPGRSKDFGMEGFNIAIRCCKGEIDVPQAIYYLMGIGVEGCDRKTAKNYLERTMELMTPILRKKGWEVIDK